MALKWWDALVSKFNKDSKAALRVALADERALRADLERKLLIQLADIDSRVRTLMAKARVDVAEAVKDAQPEVKAAVDAALVKIFQTLLASLA